METCEFEGCGFRTLKRNMRAHMSTHVTACKVNWELRCDAEIKIETRRKNFPRSKKIVQQEIKKVVESAPILVNKLPTKTSRFMVCCDACEKGPFLNPDELNNHLGSHLMCGVGGCEFQGNGVALIAHQNVVHENKKSYEVWGLNSVNEIRRWKETRSQNFPTVAKLTDVKAWDVLTNKLLDIATPTFMSNLIAKVKQGVSNPEGHKQIKNVQRLKTGAPELHEEIKNVHGPNFCQPCNKAFKTKELLMNCVKHHQKCNIAGCQFEASTNQLKVHKIRTHKTPERLSEIEKLKMAEERLREEIKMLRSVQPTEKLKPAQKKVIQPVSPSVESTCPSSIQSKSKLPELPNKNQTEDVLSAIPATKVETSSIFSCDACEFVFYTDVTIANHRSRHSKCGLHGCGFEALPGNVELHRSIIQHVGNCNLLTVWQHESPENLQIWKEERRKRFPRLENHKQIGLNGSDDIVSNSLISKEKTKELAKENNDTGNLVKEDTQNNTSPVGKSVGQLVKQTGEGALSNIPSSKDKTGSILSCDACEFVFYSDVKLNIHRRQHGKCGLHGCGFEALPGNIELHQSTIQHVDNCDLLKVWQHESLESVQNWREERRKRFPRLENHKQRTENDDVCDSLILNVFDVAKSALHPSTIRVDNCDLLNVEQGDSPANLQNWKEERSKCIPRLENLNQRTENEDIVWDSLTSEVLDVATSARHQSTMHVENCNLLPPSMPLEYSGVSYASSGISQGIPGYLQSSSVSRYHSPGLPGSSASPSLTTIGQPNYLQASTGYLPTLPYSYTAPSQILPASNQGLPEAQLLTQVSPASAAAKKESGWGETLNEWAKERMNEDLRKEISKKVDFFKVAQTTSTRENWLKFRDQSRQVALLQKKAEQLNSIISDRSEREQINERKKRNLIMLEKGDNASGSQYFCDACDLEYNVKAQLDNHVTAHSHCGLDGCKFEANPLTVKTHKTEVHAAGYSKKIWETNSPEEVVIWKEERRKNFPVPVLVDKEEGTSMEEESNTSTTLNARCSNALPNEAESSYKYYCDACNCGFTDGHQSAGHYKKHIKCGRVGCKFEGQPFAVQLHVDLVHKTTHVTNVWALNSSESIISWRKERKRKFPRLSKSFQREDEEITVTKVAEPKPVSTVMNVKPSNASKPKTTFEKKFFCDACDIGFWTKQQYDHHCSQHIVCDMVNCQFAGNKEVFVQHMKSQHVTRYAYRIWPDKTPQSVENWRRARKQNYPLLSNKVLAPDSEVVNSNVLKKRALATKEVNTRFSSLIGSSSSSSSAAESDILSQDRSKLQTSFAPKEKLPVVKSHSLINTIITEVTRSKWDEEPTAEDQSKLDKSYTHTDKATKEYWQELCNSLANNNVDGEEKSIKDKHTKAKLGSETPSLLKHTKSKWDGETQPILKLHSEMSLTKKDASKERSQPRTRNLISKSIHESKRDKEPPFQNKRSSDRTSSHSKDVPKERLRAKTVASKSIWDDGGRRTNAKAGPVDKSKDAIKRRSSPIKNRSGEKKIRNDDVGNKQVSSLETKSLETADTSKKTRSDDDKKRKSPFVQDRGCKISRKDSLDLTHRQRSPVHHHVSPRVDISPPFRSRTHSHSRSPHRSPVDHRASLRGDISPPIRSHSRSPHRESSPFHRHCRRNRSNIARSDKVITAQSSSMPDLPGVLDMIGGRTMEQNQFSAPGMDDTLSCIAALKKCKNKELKQQMVMELVKKTFGDNVAESLVGNLEGHFPSGFSLDRLSHAHAEPSFNQQPLGKEDKQALDRLSHSEPSTENHLLLRQGFVPSSDNFHPVGLQSSPKKDLFSKFLNLVGSDQKEKIAQQLAHNREKHFTGGAGSSQLHPVRVGPHFDELYGTLGKEDKQASDRLSHAKPSILNVDHLLLGQGFVSSSDNFHPVSLQNPPKKENLFSKFLNSVDNKQKDKIAQQLARNREKHFTGVASSSQLHSVRVGPQFDDFDGGKCRTSHADPSNTSDASQLLTGLVGRQFDALDGTECRTSHADSSDTLDCNEKMKLAREIANILSATGQPNISDDVLAQLVQNAMKSKNSASGLQSLKPSESCENTYPQNKRALPPVLSSLLSSSTTHCVENEK